MKIYFLFFALILHSCSPVSLSEWRVEGVSVVRNLCEELEKIHTLSDLEDRKQSIKKKYNKLVYIMIEADKCEEVEDAFSVESFYSDALREQYIRLFNIEGAKEMFLDIQRDSLHKLDREVASKSLVR